MHKVAVQFGAGNKAIDGWINYDASLTLLAQKYFSWNGFISRRLNCVFDKEVIYGDICKGLPIETASVDYLLGSHVLEHLSLQDLSLALNECFRILKPSGIFRVIIPDLKFYIKEYIKASEGNEQLAAASAALEFCRATGMGNFDSRVSIFQRLVNAFSNSRHQLMWDDEGIKSILEIHGFHNFEKFDINTVNDLLNSPLFKYQFDSSIAIQCKKKINI